MLSWLWGRRRARQPRTDLDVILYTRHGCHLCETAHHVLATAQRQHGFRLRTVDIDTAAELVERYGTCVPVVTINGRLRFRGLVNAVLLQRLLDVPPATASTAL